VGVLLEEVVLDLPRVVDAEPVGQLDLAEGVLEELELAAFRPRARELVLVGALRSASDRPRRARHSSGTRRSRPCDNVYMLETAA